VVKVVHPVDFHVHARVCRLRATRHVILRLLQISSLLKEGKNNGIKLKRL